jgi:hypothetical protein
MLCYFTAFPGVVAADGGGQAIMSSADVAS